MNIKVSDHAKERLKERIGLSPRKVESFVRKAYNSKEKLPRWANQKLKRQNKEVVMTTLMGYLFVFRKQKDTIEFKTVLTKRSTSNEYWSVKGQKIDNKKLTT